MTGNHRWNVQDGALTSTATIAGRFLPRSASWIEEMEKRSHRRIRDLDILTAFQGLVANEIGRARISMMAREQNTPFNGPNTDARDHHLQIVTSGLHRTAGPYKVYGQAKTPAISRVEDVPS
jgi:hypothetical protein